MRAKRIFAAAALVGLCSLGWMRPAAAEDKGIIALQQRVELLLSQVQDLQKSFTSSMGMIEGLVKQNTDTVNKLSSSIDGIQRALNGSQMVAAQHQTDISKQFQLLADAINDLQQRLQKMDATLQQVHQLQQTVPAPVATPVGGAGAAGGTAGSSPGAGAANTQSYSSALLDFQSGNPAAQAELAAFIRANPNDPQVPDAMYYLGSIFMQKQQYNEAIENFSSVITQYPDNAKASMAELNKGICLSKQGSRTAAISELRAVAKNYQGTEAARQADIELKGLGASRGGR
ncbi:MAG: tetratricopeptide repeat protein [Terriglobales bacterium]